MDTSILIPVAGLVIAMLAMALIAPRMAQDNKERAKKKRLYAYPCPDCQRPVHMTPGGLKPLDPMEAGMIVRLVPTAPQRHLGEVRCQHCRSTLTFRTDQWPPGFITINATEGHYAKNSCTQCHKPLRTPEFPRGAYDGNADDLKRLPPNIGLICSRCNAINCVACVVDVTRNRTSDGSLLCPRCYRGPVDKVHHG